MFKRILELDPCHVNCLISYALLKLKHKNDIDGAEASFKAALALEPRRVDLLFDLGMFLATYRQDYEACEQLFKRLLEVDPNHLHILCQNDSAAIAEMFGHSLNAAAAYKRALENTDQHAAHLCTHERSLLRQDPQNANYLYRIHYRRRIIEGRSSADLFVRAVISGI